MVDIDENNSRLLKMLESLLKTGNGTEETIEKYRALVLGMDTNASNRIIEMINNIDKHSHDLAEEGKYLEEILDAYRQLEFMQLSHMRVYDEYVPGGLELFDLTKIDIEAIENRINVIYAYLLNLDNIRLNKEELEKLNQDLVDEEKRKDLVAKRISQYEVELRKSFAKAVGEELVDGEVREISVIDEYLSNGMNFDKLLENRQELDRLNIQFSQEKSDLAEEKTAAVICYEKVPTGVNEDILNKIKVSEVAARYKLTLVQILELLVEDNDDYYVAIGKRNKLKELGKSMDNCFSEMGRHFVNNPFDSQKLDEQVMLINRLGDNSKVISSIRSKINMLSVDAEELLEQGEELLRELNKEEVFVLSEDNQEVEEADILDNTDLMVEVSDWVSDNQVVTVFSVSDDFQLDMAVSKALEVITRVNGMISEEKPIDEIVPELLLEEVSRVDETAEENLLEEKKLDIETSEETEQMFMELKPFDDAPLFADKLDEDLFPQTNDKGVVNSFDGTDIVADNDILDNSQNDMFWISQADELEKEENQANSIDDEIVKLVNDTDNDGKKKKLVA